MTSNGGSVSSVPGFQTLAKGRFGVAVQLPDGGAARGLFDHSTKAESVVKFESQVLAGTPSLVLEDGSLRIGDRIKVSGPSQWPFKAYEIRDMETDPDGMLTRYFLTEAQT